MFSAFREYTLDLWDLLVGNKYPRETQLTRLREHRARQQINQTKLSPEKSLSPPPIVRQATVLGWTETVDTGSVCIKQFPHHHEEF